MTDVLPIDAVLPELEAALKESGCAVLTAEPGAGKTTRVPPFLLNSNWLGSKKVIMLEPRRLAAKTAARFIASEMNEEAGQTVGYRIRGDSKVSAKTRIEIVTEGILVRMIQDDPALEAAGAVVFDEFHERSIHADLGLALCLEIKKTIRPDLRIIVMSATIESDFIAGLLGSIDSPCPVIHAPGRVFPVELRMLGDDDSRPVEARAAGAAARALRDFDGDVLVFMPGRGEIARTIERLGQEQLPAGTEVLPLSSETGEGAERRALQPAGPGKRKIIVATNIAETSLTIDGVRSVVDAGLMRVSRYDPGRAMSGLVTVPVSQASAAQRAGRAGRQAPGVCYRLWSQSKESTFPRYNDPEIVQTDLTPFALELAVWGDPAGNRLALPTRPPAGVLAQARQLLFDLEAVDADGRVTAHGREISRLGVHPRLAHMIIRGKLLGFGAEACDAAAILEERDLVPGAAMGHGGGRNPGSAAGKDLDLGLRYMLLLKFRTSGNAGGLSRPLLQRIEIQARQLRKLAGIGTGKEGQIENLGTVLGLAYPDRIGMRRGDDPTKFILRNGIGVTVPRTSLLAKERFIVAAELDGGGADARLFLGEPISETAVRSHFGALISRESDVRWDEAAERVTAFEVERLGAIELSKRPARPDEQKKNRVLLDWLKRRGLLGLLTETAAEKFLARAAWLKKSGVAGEDWPGLDEQSLVESAESWLFPYLSGVSSRADLERLDLLEPLKSLFSWEQLQVIEKLSPAQVSLPSGSVVAIDYRTDPPSISAVLQEFLGQRTTPVIGRGTALTVQILSPARRPLQVTRDLESFWNNSYREVRKEMIGRYPKHFWPEDPLSEAPRQKSRKRKGE